MGRRRRRWRRMRRRTAAAADVSMRERGPATRDAR
jgi:hypothetical protein